MDALTLRDAAALGRIVTAAMEHQRVARGMDNGKVIYGTARSIGDQAGNFATDADDVRCCFLRVTTTTGLEAFWPTRELIEAMHDGTFLVGPETPPG